MISRHMAGHILAGNPCHYVEGSDAELEVSGLGNNRRIKLRSGGSHLEGIYLESWIGVDGDLVVVTPEASISLSISKPEVGA